MNSQRFTSLKGGFQHGNNSARRCGCNVCASPGTTESTRMQCRNLCGGSMSLRRPLRTKISHNLWQNLELTCIRKKNSQPNWKRFTTLPSTMLENKDNEGRIRIRHAISSIRHL